MNYARSVKKTQQSGPLVNRLTLSPGNTESKRRFVTKTQWIKSLYRLRCFSGSCSTSRAAVPRCLCSEMRANPVANTILGITRRQVVLGGGAMVVAAVLPRASHAAEPFRIGALNPITGAASPYGAGMQKSILFAAAEVNEAGGAAGRRFEVFAEDDQTNPDAGILATKKLVEINKVEAVLGVWSSSVGLAIMPYLNVAN